MKPREPNSIAEAVTAVISGLGASAAAEIVGKSPNLMHTWMDPDHGGCPTVRQAMALESAYVAKGLGEPPILILYAQRLGSVVRPHQRMDPMIRLVDCVAEIGDITHAIRQATDPNGPRGTTITLNESAVVAREIDEAVAVLLKLKKDIAKTHEADDFLRVLSRKDNEQ